MTTPRPRIAVTWPRQAPRTPDHYLRPLEAAGGLPVLVTPATGLDRLQEVDGLLLVGGWDVDPPLYGQDPDPQVADTLEIDRERDDLELAVIDVAQTRDLPVLGICRGIQVLNVALGGTLVQDLSLWGISPPTHQQRAQNPPPEEWEPVHTVQVEEESRLTGILGDGRVPVNSFHHQAADRPAPGLRVTARSPDGVIEALEGTDGRFVVGVQWHPERMVGHDARQRALFEAFIAAARAREPGRAR